MNLPPYRQGRGGEEDKRPVFEIQDNRDNGQVD